MYYLSHICFPNCASFLNFGAIFRQEKNKHYCNAITFFASLRSKKKNNNKSDKRHRICQIDLVHLVFEY